MAIPFCSKPKFGKSWLAYDLCIGCTMNRMIWGIFCPPKAMCFISHLKTASAAFSGGCPSYCLVAARGRDI